MRLVGAGRAPHAVVGVAGGDVDPVAARPGDHDRGALEVDQPVVAATAVEPIAAGAAEDVVVAGTAGEPLTASVAVDQVVAAPAPDLRAGPAGTELVVPRAAHDRLAFAEPDDEVHPSRHAREQRLLGGRDLRVATEPRAGVELQQPRRELVTGAIRPCLLRRRGDASRQRDRRRQGPASTSDLRPNRTAGMPASSAPIAPTRTRRAVTDATSKSDGVNPGAGALRFSLLW